jgi:hypothetical protein
MYIGPSIYGSSSFDQSEGNAVNRGCFEDRKLGRIFEHKKSQVITGSRKLYYSVRICHSLLLI